MRVVTAGSSTRKSRTSRRGEIGSRRPETGGTAGGIGLSLYAAAHQIPYDLQAVEARVAHHRRDGAAAAQVDDGPDRAEQAGGQRRVPPLERMSRAERDARHR